eukprot:scaffold175911_cov32-Prasinocladus_malaysianus.AAC.1
MELLSQLASVLARISPLLSAAGMFIWFHSCRYHCRILGCAGPTIPWRPGRGDAAGAEACPPKENLPDAAQGAAHLRDVFYRMGFNDQEIVALSGAHTLGRSDNKHTDGCSPCSCPVMHLNMTEFLISTVSSFRIMNCELWLPHMISPKISRLDVWHVIHDWMCVKTG